MQIDCLNADAEMMKGQSLYEGALISGPREMQDAELRGPNEAPFLVGLLERSKAYAKNPVD